MKLYRLHTMQDIKISLDEAWDFFSDPRNLAKITPDHLSFNILSELPEKMYAGMIIEYTIKPVAGIPIRWITEITQVREKEFFIDEQRAGPYKFWHHQHMFEEIDGGTRMYDTVHYAVPFGIFGRIANSLFVKRQVNMIFDFRHRILENKFNK